MTAGERIETATETLNDVIISRSRTVVIGFLVLTVIFAGGFGLVTTDTDATDSFTDDLPEQDALDSVNEEFEGPFQTSDETTQLVHTGENVLTKEALVRSLLVLERVEQGEDLRMESANGPAPLIAQTIDPTATTPSEQRRVIESATTTEIRQAIRAQSDDPTFKRTLSKDFNPTTASASASITVISHDIPNEFTDDDLTDIQLSIKSIASDQPGDIRAFGSGITDAETANVIGDSMTLVMPVVVLLLLAFLAISYRDPIDLALGLLALLMTVIWTFGFLGYSGIPFNQQMISVPVLLLAVGVDFGIHIVNRYREETVQGYEPLEAMRTANNQLMIAFVIVTVTTVFGFGANVISDLGPIRNMGIASSVGIIFTFFIFGIFLPAAKLEVDQLRERFGIPEFGSDPIASEDSSLGRLLAMPARASRHAPLVFVVVIIVMGGAAAGYGAGVDTSFDTEDFLPPEDQRVRLIRPGPARPQRVHGNGNDQPPRRQVRHGPGRVSQDIRRRIVRGRPRARGSSQPERRSAEQPRSRFRRQSGGTEHYHGHPEPRRRGSRVRRARRTERSQRQRHPRPEPRSDLRRTVRVAGRLAGRTVPDRRPAQGPGRVRHRRRCVPASGGRGRRRVRHRLPLRRDGNGEYRRLRSGDRPDLLVVGPG